MATFYIFFTQGAQFFTVFDYPLKRCLNTHFTLSSLKIRFVYKY